MKYNCAGKSQTESFNMKLHCDKMCIPDYEY